MKKRRSRNSGGFVKSPSSGLYVPARLAPARRPGKMSKPWLENVDLYSGLLMSSSSGCCPGSRCLKCTSPGPYVEMNNNGNLWAALSVAVGAYGFFDCEDEECSTCLGAVVLFGGIWSESYPGAWCEDWGPGTGNPGSNDHCNVTIWATKHSMGWSLCGGKCTSLSDEDNGVQAGLTTITTYSAFGFQYLVFGCYAQRSGYDNVYTNSIDVPFQPCNS